VDHAVLVDEKGMVIVGTARVAAAAKLRFNHPGDRGARLE
jgi:hypothetical protein